MTYYYERHEDGKHIEEKVHAHEFIEYMHFISSIEEISEDDYKEMWAEDEAAKFYGYDDNDNQFHDGDLLFLTNFKKIYF